MAMNVAAVHTQATLSILKQSLNMDTNASKKLFQGLEQASTQIQGATHPTKGHHIDVRA